MTLWDTLKHCNSLRKNPQVANSPTSDWLVSPTVLKFFDKSIERWTELHQFESCICIICGCHGNSSIQTWIWDRSGDTVDCTIARTASLELCLYYVTSFSERVVRAEFQHEGISLHAKVCFKNVTLSSSHNLRCWLLEETNSVRFSKT